METNNNQKTYGLNIVSLILGIVALVFWCIFFISIPCAILSLIFGFMGISKKGKAMGITGIVTGAVTISIWYIIISLIFIGGFVETIQDNYYDEEYIEEYDDNINYNFEEIFHKYI